MDVARQQARPPAQDKRFHFVEGDITINEEWIEYHVKKCDVVVPLVAIANPAQYVKDPLRVFELDFEANLDIVRHCVKYSKRIIFPSTSEVYGMCPGRRAQRGDQPARLRPDRQAALDLRQLQAAPRPRHLRLRRARRRRLHPLPAVQLDRPEARQRLRAQGGQLAPLHAVHLERHFTDSRSSSSTAADRAARSPSSTTASTRCCASSRTRTAAPRAASSTSATRRTTCSVAAARPSASSPRSGVSRSTARHARQAKIVVVPSGDYFGKYYQDIQKRVPNITQPSATWAGSPPPTWTPPSARPSSST